MDSRNDLIGKKVLIISNSIGSSYKKLYCSYVLGEITGYNPDTNKIMVIINTQHADSPIEFKIMIINLQQENQKMIMKNGGIQHLLMTRLYNC